MHGNYNVNKDNRSKSYTSSLSREVLGLEACYGLGLSLRHFISRPNEPFPLGRYLKIAFEYLPAFILFTQLLWFSSYPTTNLASIESILLLLPPGRSKFSDGYAIKSYS
jgi:hypothetical protein